MGVDSSENWVFSPMYSEALSGIVNLPSLSLCPGADTNGQRLEESCGEGKGAWPKRNNPSNRESVRRLRRLPRRPYYSAGGVAVSYGWWYCCSEVWVPRLPGSVGTCWPSG